MASTTVYGIPTGIIVAIEELYRGASVAAGEAQAESVAVRRLRPEHGNGRYIMAARWEHLDLANSRLAHRRLFIPDAKAGEREPPLMPELAEMLAREREMRDDRESWIFPRRIPTARSGIVSMDRPFREAVRTAGLDPETITPHVHGRHIDQAIQAIGRTIPKRPADGTANTITRELHTTPIAVLPGSRCRGPKSA